jgi:hypothetical protein
MSDTATRDERRSALDEFAASMRTEQENLGQLTVIQQQPQEVVPAQDIKVRRDTKRVLAELAALAAAAGDDWYYRWPVKDRKRDRTDWVEGPSIKMANDLARIYGNNKVFCPLIEDRGTHWIFHGCFVDLETGFNLSRPFQQRKSASRMGDDAERRLDIAFQIGVSKAERNVVVNALQTFADFALTEAKAAIVDKIGKNIEGYRQRLLERLASNKVAVERVEAVVGRAAKDWLAPDIARVIAMMTAIADGMATLNETFPPLHEEQQPSGLDQFVASGAGNASSEDPGKTPRQDGAEVEASAPQAPAQASAPPDYHDAIDRLLKAATDKKVDQDDRAGNIASLQPVYADAFPDDAEFVKELIMTSIKVAKGELPAAAARKHLEGWIR